MSVKQLDHLNLTVKSLEESIDFYQRLFGFEPVEGGVMSGVPWRILKSGEAMLCLYERPGYRPVSNGQRRTEQQHGMNHFGLRITDRPAFERRLVDTGIQIDHEWKYPNSHSWYLFDPTGYEIEVAHWNDDQIQF